MSIKYVDFSHNSYTFRYIQISTMYNFLLFLAMVRIWLKYNKHVKSYTEFNYTSIVYPAHGITSLTSFWRRFKLLSSTLLSVHGKEVKVPSNPALNLLLCLSSIKFRFIYILDYPKLPSIAMENAESEQLVLCYM